MKKIISSILTLALVASVVGFGSESTNASSKKTKTIQVKSNIINLHSETARDVKLEAAIKKALGGYDKARDGEIRYNYNKVDLNGDKKNEIFVMLTGLSVSGRGGNMSYIFKNDYTVASNFTLVNPPIIISETKTKGWKDIIMPVSGGGAEPFNAVMKFNGKKYPLNPSVQPAIKDMSKIKGTSIISEKEVKGIVLQ